ncbi:MAG: hypothetical protein ACOX4K_03205 [Bacillota bacterium]
MSIRDIRWKYVLLWALVILSILSLANYSYRILGLERPLEKSLARDPDVAWSEVTASQNKTVVKVSLKYVEDLSLTHLRIEETVKAALGNRDYEIVVQDVPDEILEKAYASIHYYVEEARIRGNFGEMARQSTSVLEEAGIDDFKLTVNQDRIYVQLRLQSHYLYKIMKLKDVKGGTEL